MRDFQREVKQMQRLQAALGCLVIVALFTPLLGVPTIKAVGGVNYEYSEGTRSGTVQKIAKKGFIWRTWEGELNLGYATSKPSGDAGTTIVPAIWHFSAVDDSVAEELLDAERSGGRITIEYKQYILAGYKNGSTGYVATGVSRE